MPPRKDDDFMDVDSDSDISIPDDRLDHGARKGKGKAKASDKRKRDKGKGKAKDAVSPSSCHQSTLIQDSPVGISKHIHGKHLIHAHGTQSKRMRREVCKVQLRNGWRAAEDGGLPSFLHSNPPSIILSIRQQVTRSLHCNTTDDYSTFNFTTRLVRVNDGPRYATDAV
jgi:hypothetical protein